MSQLSASFEPYKQEVTSMEINGYALEYFLPLSAGISMNGSNNDKREISVSQSKDQLLERMDVLALRGLVSFKGKKVYLEAFSPPT